MKRGIYIYVLSALVALLGLSQPLFASDRPTLRAYMERDSVAIGDVTAIVLEVEQDVMQVVAFPEYDLSGDALLESAGAPTLDTLSREGRRVRLRRRYLLRTFDEGRYNLGLPSVLYAGRGLQEVADTLYSSDTLFLSVATFLIDSTSHAIFDMKVQRDLPFEYGEISGYVKWGLLIVVVTLLLALGVLKIMSRYGYSTFGIFDVAPPVPPHVTAFKALDTLRGEQLWQGGEYKLYYSALTDILRAYISGRFGIAALEMTSDEIIDAVRGLEGIPQRCEMELLELLRDADLVKFAKAEIDATRNEGYFASARSFVELTMEREEMQEETQEQEEQWQAQEAQEAGEAQEINNQDVDVKVEEVRDER